MWRERIQVVFKYFDFRLHQIVQSTDEENGGMRTERIQVVVDYFDSRFHQIVQFRLMKGSERMCRERPKAIVEYLTPAFTRLYSRQNERKW